MWRVTCLWSYWSFMRKGKERENEREIERDLEREREMERENNAALAFAESLFPSLTGLS